MGEFTLGLKWLHVENEFKPLVTLKSFLDLKKKYNFLEEQQPLAIHLFNQLTINTPGGYQCSYSLKT